MSDKESPKPIPRPSAIPHPLKTNRTASLAVNHSADEESDWKAATEFGRVDEEGRVWLKDRGEERQIAHYPTDIPQEPLALYIRRFLDLKAQVELASSRLGQMSTNDIDASVKSLEKALIEPTAIGDLDALRKQVADFKAAGEIRKSEIIKERDAQRKIALEERTKIVTTAEKIAQQDPAKTQWKQSGQRLCELLEQWKDQQRKGPRIDRSTEDALWKRFSSARTAFDRHRKQFFSQLDATQAQVKEIKENIIKRAEKISDSTDWHVTAGVFRDLMNEWRKAGRASKQDDDALWERFRNAQKKFFSARDNAQALTDAEELENLRIKEEIAEKAEAILPITNISKAKATLRPLLEAWDKAGRIPRSELSRMEKRIRAVESAISVAENEEWQRSNPETKARANGLVGQLEALLADLQSKLDLAIQTADIVAQKRYEEEIATRTAWLEQAKRAANA